MTLEQIESGRLRTMGLLGLRPLTEREQALLDAAEGGRPLDLSTGDPTHDDVVCGHGWGDDRTVRAELLYQLLAGAGESSPPRAVVLRGARIGGGLNLESASLVCPLILQDCFFDAPVNLMDARAPVIRLTGCHMPCLAADQLETRGELELDRLTTTVISLTNAHIGGQLGLDGAKLSGGGWPLDLSGVTLRPSQDAAPSAPQLQGAALVADRLAVDQSMFCQEGFTAEGEVRLVGARIGGQLGFNGASLSNPGGVALRLNEASVGASLWLRLAAQPNGELDLTSMRVAGALYDSEQSWPTALRVRGCTYDHLEAKPKVDSEARLRWLQRDSEGYSPQPYEQLIAFYRRSGHDGAARQAAIAKQRKRRAELRGMAKVWNFLLDWTVAYGYRTWQAALGLLLLLPIGTAVFAHAHPDDVTAVEGRVSDFQAFIYTLDLLIPVINLHQRDEWIADGAAQWWALGFTLGGWVLTTAVVAALTGILKRD